jgi:desampylase
MFYTWAMGLIISSELRAKLLSEAQKAHPAECCGLLIGQNGTVNDTATDIQPAANVSKTPLTHFEIDPAILISAEKSARVGHVTGSGTGNNAAILGYYHSHPTGEAMPSQTDAAMAAPDGRYWVVIAGGELGVFKAAEDGEIWGRFEAVGVDLA